MCCGNENYTDWLNTTWYENQKNSSVKYPTSCCSQQKCDYELPGLNNTHLYQDVSNWNYCLKNTHLYQVVIVIKRCLNNTNAK